MWVLLEILFVDAFGISEALCFDQRGAKPVARLVPIEAPAKPRAKAGVWKDRPGFGFSESFFDPLPDDELALWNGAGE